MATFDLGTANERLEFSDYLQVAWGVKATNIAMAFTQREQRRVWIFLPKWLIPYCYFFQHIQQNLNGINITATSTRHDEYKAWLLEWIVYGILMALAINKHSHKVCD